MTTSETKKRPRIVILGAGFGGLWTAKYLAKADADIVIVDRNNYHTFFPLLYQVAAAEVEPEQIAAPVRGIFRGRDNVEFIMDEIQWIDFAQKQVLLCDRRLDYDYLVLSVGSVNHFFNTPGAEEHTFTLKTLEQGIELRNHVLSCFEYATTALDPDKKRAALTFAIVGGGPTGVEFSGALAELTRGALARDFPTLDISQVRILLLEAADSLLTMYPEHLRAYTKQKLEALGVEVRTGAKVTEVTPEKIVLGSGDAAEELPTNTVAWTAGIKGVPMVAGLDLELARGGRIPTLPTLQLKDHPEVFAIGDICGVEQNGRQLPQLGRVAMDQGRHTAKNLLLLLNGKQAKPFVFRSKGSMATIGRNAAVGQMHKFTFSGLFAWVVWLVIHNMYLVGFRNRLFVLINWARDYFFYDRSVRLILPKKLPCRK